MCLVRSLSLAVVAKQHFCHRILRARQIQTRVSSRSRSTCLHAWLFILFIMFLTWFVVIATVASLSASNKNTQNGIIPGCVRFGSVPHGCAGCRSCSAGSVRVTRSGSSGSVPRTVRFVRFSWILTISDDFRRFPTIFDDFQPVLLRLPLTVFM